MNVDEHKVALWPDGTCCELDELEEYLTFMSDDYEIVNQPQENRYDHLQIN